jgi:hypothetical protein
MGRPAGTRFANGSKPCLDCGEPCDAYGYRCQRCEHIRQRRPYREPTLGDVLWNAIPGENGCLLFVGSFSGAGYGLIRRMSNGTVHRWAAHRVVFERSSGPIPPGYEIHHRCGVKRCVNPAHLEAVTRLEHRGKNGRHPEHLRPANVARQLRSSARAG